ncbi:GNAT family N-acetyltransferase (plasmid) [Streptomyces sp. BI20]|uniref:GNAT family N-acetyltransferase n=1 Tax=Streptomyces sp. BI20 TaxID=3403460 RepID=UPI003C72D0C8
MIRTATPDDVPEILAMVRELADYEKAVHEARATEEQFLAALFGPNPAARALIAETESGAIAGFALWYPTFSTWRGVPGIHLEDLYVRPAHRGGGHGRALLAELAGICADRGWQRLEWAVLRWNEPTIAFYRSLDAEPLTEWETYRLTDGPLARLAAEAR